MECLQNKLRLKTCLTQQSGSKVKCLLNATASMKEKSSNFVQIGTVLCLEMLALLLGCCLQILNGRPCRSQVRQMKGGAQDSPVDFLLKLCVSPHLLFQSPIDSLLLLCYFLGFLLLGFHLNTHHKSHQLLCSINKQTSHNDTHMAAEFSFFLFKLCETKS